MGDDCRNQAGPGAIGHLGSTRRSHLPMWKKDLTSTAPEPYVYAQMIAGRDAVNHGEAKNSLADRHCCLELRGYHAGDSRHSA